MANQREAGFRSDMHETDDSSQHAPGTAGSRQDLAANDRGAGPSGGVSAQDAPAVHQLPEREPPPNVRIRFLHANIGNVGEDDCVPPREPVPIDAIAVGHYRGVPPVAAEKAIDVAISGADTNGSDDNLVIAGLTQRRIISGNTAQPFLLPDPRKPGRTVAIACMGDPGRFGPPELICLVRELCWTLGRLGKTHLATVLIGSGNGNIQVDPAVHGWLRGINMSLDEVSTASQRLQVITFVEAEPAKLEHIQDAFLRAPDSVANSCIEIIPMSQAEVEAARARGSLAPVQPPRDVMPARIVVDVFRKKYRFSALTQTAAAPSAQKPLNVNDIAAANAAVKQSVDESAQLDRGTLLYNEVVPRDLRHTLRTTPLVLVCDRDAAQIHWEVMVEAEDPGAAGACLPPVNRVLGLARGLTRQLKTSYAQTSDPLPRASKVLRALVIADSSRDEPLAGARKEGELVSELLQQFKHTETARRTGCHIDVTPLIGPEKASKDKVQTALVKNQYDILHFAGPGDYDDRHPNESGWVFSSNSVLTAEELIQMDRLPQFVFSNACDTGIVPRRLAPPYSLRAPSFAEAFFARGVANFVCTAWDINDNAAFEFARVFYTCLLGMDRPPQPMYLAMQEARRAARATQPEGIQSWGAYQHYGDPYFRLFPA